MRKAAALLVGSLLAGALAVLPATAAQATTWYASCGPKINIASGTSGIKMIRSGIINYYNTLWVEIRLNRGLKSGYGQTGIWWAKLDTTWGYANVGDQANLNWTDYHPDDKANYCRDTITSGESYALTWGVNAVASSANPWGRRMFAAYGRKNYNGSLIGGAANINPSTNDYDSYWVVSY
jgi:hypothetical protein